MRPGVLVMVMLCLSDGKVTVCSVEMIITVRELRKVSISCPPTLVNSTEIKFLLFFNDTCISQINMHQRNLSWAQDYSLLLHTESIGKQSLNSAGSTFSGQFEVTAYNSGVYVCKREVIYPPPLTMQCHTTEVIVAETHSLPTINDTVSTANQTCPVRFPFIPEEVMWVGYGVLLVYSLSITCITIVIWRKSKRDGEDTNVYENVKPGQPRKPSKV